MEIAGTFLSLILLFAQWFFGAKKKREQRAKEIAKKLKSVSVKGDKFIDQAQEELNRHSDKHWDDIPVRDFKEEDL